MSNIVCLACDLNEVQANKLIGKLVQANDALIRSKKGKIKIQTIICRDCFSTFNSSLPNTNARPTQAIFKSDKPQTE